MNSSNFEIATDGACRGNPGPGGWAAIIRDQEGERELYGNDPDTTNNRMELLAVIHALRTLPESSSVRIKSDSQYLIKGCTEWILNWKRRGWRTKDKKPVKNQDLWQELSELMESHSLEWQWVRGHSGDPDNERADALANLAIDQLEG